MDQRSTEIINRNRQPGIPAKSNKSYHDALGLRGFQIILMLMSTHILGPRCATVHQWPGPTWPHHLISDIVTLSDCQITNGTISLEYTRALTWPWVKPRWPWLCCQSTLRNHFGRTTILINWLLMPLGLFDIWCCKGVGVLGQVFVRDYQSAQESLLGVSKALPQWDHISNLKSSGYEY